MTSSNTAREVQKRLKKLGDPEHAAVGQRFFKTGPGEYGEGDKFLGIRMPVLRELAGEFRDLPVSEGEILLHSPFHEERMLAILILIRKFKKKDGKWMITMDYDSSEGGTAGEDQYQNASAIDDFDKFIQQ